MSNINLKKFFSFTAIIVITAVVGGALSYVRAAYVEPAGSPMGNNSPAAVLSGNADKFPNSETGYFKMGKLGVTKDKTNSPVDDGQFNAHSLVVMGLLTTDSLTSSYTNRIRAELETNSALYPLYVGDPTNSTFMQNNVNSSPLTFKVTEHTRVPRMVIGSKTASADLYNFYVEPGSNATNMGKNNSYCTLTADKLKSTGCPVRTYMGQIIPGTGSEVVVSCYDTTPVASPVNKGACS